MKRRMRSNRNSGFTLVEMLATVGILVILLAVSAVAVTSYVDELKIAELDNAAREIYMAAENRAVLLSVAERMDDLMTEKIVITDAEGNVIATRSQRQRGESAELSNVPTCVDDEELRHTSDEKLYVVSAADLGDDLLTYGAIDQTLLDNGYFYIVYKLYTYDDDKEGFTGGGSVTDVFYAEEPLNFEALVDGLDGTTGITDFEKFYSKWADTRSNRVALKRTNRKPLVGWYNGKADGGGVHDPETPFINVNIVNKEMLTVTVSYTYITYDDSPAATLKVLLSDGENTITKLKDDVTYYKERIIGITGVTPGVEVCEPNIDGKTYTHAYECTWVLDSLMDNREESPTIGQPLQFKDLVDGTDFTPGSDFKVVATLTPNEGVHLDEVSAEDVNNSLFQEGSGGSTAYINNLRHLQNLDTEVYASGVEEKTAAVQTGQILGSGNDSVKDSEGNTVDIYSGYNFVPILNDKITEYDGRNNEILNLNVNYNGYKKVTVEEDGSDENDESGDPRTVTKIVPAGSVNEGEGAAVIDDAGLFKAADNMTLSNIRLVNTTVTVEAGEFVGTLAGQTTGTTISNCWVYWDEEHVKNLTSDPPVLGNELGSDEAGYTYQLIGKTVGGLVGQANGTTEIVKSLAATLLQGTSNTGNVGGLVGQTASGSTTTISTSYADCYLTGKGNVAGLVGNVAGTATLNDCYAAGFIIVDENNNNNAGLCLGTGEKCINATNVYSVMVRPGADADADTSVPSIPLVAKENRGETFSNCYSLGQGKVMNNDAFVSTMNKGTSSFIKKGKKTDEENSKQTYSKQTYPYYLETYLRERKTEEVNVAYDYPGLKDMPHYGDWGKEPPAKNLALVYYEKYLETDDTTDIPDATDVTDTASYSYGVYGYKVSEQIEYNMKDPDSGQNDGKTIVKDGYAVVFSKADITYDTDLTAVTVKIKYYVDDEEMEELGEFVYAVPDPVGSEPDSSHTSLTIWSDAGDEVQYLIPLPDSLVIDADAPEDFYGYVAFKLYDADGNAQLSEGAYYFNPHFPNMVQSNTDEGEAIKPKDEDVPKVIDIRTPRHLYHLSQYEKYYSSENKFTFNQIFDLDYETYNEYGALVVNTSGNSGSTRDPQSAIGTDIKPFNGTYNGNNKNISRLVIVEYNTEVGLFGYSTGEINNVILDSTCAITGNENVGGIVGHNAGKVSGCTNYSTVTGSSYVGGIAGKLEGKTGSPATIENCFNGVQGNIQVARVTGTSYVGGLVGSSSGDQYAQILNSTNYADVIGSRDEGVFVGGLVGDNGGYLATKTGELGSSGEGRYICQNYGNVTGHQYVGGIAGRSSGIVDGNNAIIGRITVTGNMCVGGFVGINNGTVQNCERPETDDDYSIEFDIPVTASYIGGIVGLSGKADTSATDVNRNAKVINCQNNADVGFDEYQWSYVGGIVGYNYGYVGTTYPEEVDGEKGTVLTNRAADFACVNTGDITGLIYVGGLVGYNDGGTVDGGLSRENSGTVKGTGVINDDEVYEDDEGDEVDEDDEENEKVESNTGGFVGYNSGGTVKNCIAVANQKITGDYQNIGGIVGKNDNGMVEYCINESEIVVASTNANNLGGIVGLNQGEQAPAATGAITLEADGIVDEWIPANGKGIIRFCYNTGTAASLAQGIGGLVGTSNGGLITDCYNIGKVFGSDYVGGILGRGQTNSARIEFCYNYGYENNSFGTETVSTYTLIRNVASDPDLVEALFGEGVSLNSSAGTQVGYIVGSGNVKFPASTAVEGNSTYTDKLETEKDYRIAMGENYADGSAEVQIVRTMYLGSNSISQRGSGMRNEYTFYHLTWMAGAMNRDKYNIWTKTGTTGMTLERPILTKLKEERVGWTPEGIKVDGASAERDKSITTDAFADGWTSGKTYTVTLTLDPAWVPLYEVDGDVNNEDAWGKWELTITDPKGVISTAYIEKDSTRGNDRENILSYTFANESNHDNTTGTATLTVTYTVKDKDGTEQKCVLNLTVDINGLVGIAFFGGSANGGAEKSSDLYCGDGLNLSRLYFRHLMYADGNPYVQNAEQVKGYVAWSDDQKLTYQFTRIVITNPDKSEQNLIPTPTPDVPPVIAASSQVPVPNLSTSIIQLTGNETATLTVAYKVTCNEYTVTKTETITLHAGNYTASTAASDDMVVAASDDQPAAEPDDQTTVTPGDLPAATPDDQTTVTSGDLFAAVPGDQTAAALGDETTTAEPDDQATTSDDLTGVPTGPDAFLLPDDRSDASLPPDNGLPAPEDVPEDEEEVEL